MKKRNKYLRIFAAIIAFLLIAWLASLMLEIYGNPFAKTQKEKELIAYKEEHFPDIEQTFTCSSVQFNTKFDNYYLACEHNKQPLLTLEITENGDGELYDDYDFNVKEGVNALAIAGNQVLRKIENESDDLAFVDTLLVIVETPLDEQPGEIREAFLANEAILDLPMFTVSRISARHEQYEDPIYVKEQFTILHDFMKLTSVKALNYKITFFDVSGNVGYELHGVTPAILEDEHFSEWIIDMKSQPLLYQESKGMYRVNLEGK